MSSSAVAGAAAGALYSAHISSSRDGTPNPQHAMQLLWPLPQVDEELAGYLKMLDDADCGACVDRALGLQSPAECPNGGAGDGDDASVALTPVVSGFDELLCLDGAGTAFALETPPVSHILTVEPLSPDELQSVCSPELARIACEEMNYLDEVPVDVNVVVTAPSTPLMGAVTMTGAEVATVHQALADLWGRVRRSRTHTLAELTEASQGTHVIPAEHQRVYDLRSALFHTIERVNKRTGRRRGMDSQLKEVMKSAIGTEAVESLAFRQFQRDLRKLEYNKVRSSHNRASHRRGDGDSAF
jgi:hypothetical protein